MTMSSDHIRRTAVVSEPIDRVWTAISDSQQFGAWFGAEIDGPFVPGSTLAARIVPTKVDAEVAKMQEPHAGTAFAIYVEQVEPKHLLSFRWHPYAVEPKDYETEPTTLVEFHLSEVPDGTQVLITESGFGGLPPRRRAEAFKSNEGGWEHQLRLIEKYVTAPERSEVRD